MRAVSGWAQKVRRLVAILPLEVCLGLESSRRTVLEGHMWFSPESDISFRIFESSARKYYRYNSDKIGLLYTFRVFGAIFGVIESLMFFRNALMGRWISLKKVGGD